MLLKLLSQIRAGKAVHYPKLLALLPPQFYQQRSQLFKVKQLTSGKWQVLIADPRLFEALWHSAQTPSDRITASWQGDSHQVRNSHSYLLRWHSGLWPPALAAPPTALLHAVSDAPVVAIAAEAMPTSTPASISTDTQQMRDVMPTVGAEVLVAPDVVVVRQQGEQITLVQGQVQPKSQLLLIENESAFFAWQAVLRQANHMLMSMAASNALAAPLSLANTDIVLAAGSKISSALVQPYLAQYQRIYCAFDYDVAGLSLFDALARRIAHWPAPQPRLQLVVADDLAAYRYAFRAQPKQPSLLAQAIALAERYQWQGLAAMFQQTQHFAEQELLYVGSATQGVLPT
jgi:hypothetical protein